MSSNGSRSRRAKGLFALAAVVGAAAAIAAPGAGAAVGGGSATLTFPSSGKGRTLSGQGVRVVPAAPASRQGESLTLPISAVDPNAPSAVAGGSLNFKHGKRAVRLSELRFDLAAGTLVGKLGKTELPVFWLGATPSADRASGAVSLNGGQLRLTEIAAMALREKLGLERKLKRKGAGTVALSAKADPTRAAPVPIVSGGATWGVRAALRGYILSPPAGSISLADGATANGPLSSPATVFGFPGASGSFVKGLYGAGDELRLKVQGNVTFAKPGHCIEALRFANLEVKIAGDDSSITVDSTFDEGPAPCPDGAPVTTEDVELGKLNLSGISPTWSADGQTVSWTAIPATVTPAGETAFGGFLKTGAELEPITITVGLG